VATCYWDRSDDHQQLKVSMYRRHDMKTGETTKSKCGKANEFNQ